MDAEPTCVGSVVVAVVFVSTVAAPAQWNVTESTAPDTGDDDSWPLLTVPPIASAAAALATPWIEAEAPPPAAYGMGDQTVTAWGNEPDSPVHAEFPYDACAAAARS